MREKRLIQIHVNIRPDQKETLDTIWHNRGVGISEMVREALDDWLDGLKNGRRTNGNALGSRLSLRG